MRGIIHFLCYYAMLFFAFVLCYIHSLRHSTSSSHKLSIMKTINYDTTTNIINNYHDIQYSIGINRYSSVYKKERIGRYLLRLKGSSNDEVINKTRMKTNSNNTNKRRKMNNNNNDTGNRYKSKGSSSRDSSNRDSGGGGDRRSTKASRPKQLSFEDITCSKRVNIDITNFQSIQDTSLLSSITKQALLKKGFVTLTPIQSQSYPFISSSVDIIARSKTGSGKTLAFGIPLIEMISIKKFKDRSSSSASDDGSSSSIVSSPSILILEPTRELALQVIIHIYVYIYDDCDDDDGEDDDDLLQTSLHPHRHRNHDCTTVGDARAAISR